MHEYNNNNENFSHITSGLSNVEEAGISSFIVNCSPTVSGCKVILNKNRGITSGFHFCFKNVTRKNIRQPHVVYFRTTQCPLSLLQIQMIPPEKKSNSSSLSFAATTGLKITNLYTAKIVTSWCGTTNEVFTFM